MPAFVSQKRSFKGRKLALLALFSFLISGGWISASQAQSSQEHLKKKAEALLDDRCESCHNDMFYSGNWSIYDVDINDVEQGKNQRLWEAMLKSVSMGDMPPSDKKPLDPEKKRVFLQWLESSLDNYADEKPNPGRATIRRLNRNEYARSVSDLLDIDVDVSAALPGDDSGYGFDNNADVLTMSTTLLERYLSVAGKLSRLATGVGGEATSKTTYVTPKDGSVKNSGLPSFDLRMSDKLPLDSRGGGAFDYYAPHPGRYEIAAYINANTNNEVDRLDIHRHSHIVTLTAGSHSIGATFRKNLSLSEYVPTVREGTDLVVLPEHPPSLLPLDFIVDGARVKSTRVPSYHMSSRFSQATFLRDVLEIEVIGPLPIENKADSVEQENLVDLDTPSQRKIFTCDPETGALSEIDCARKIITPLIREAYRRPVSELDVQPILKIFERANFDLDFKESIATAIQALLVAPNFIYLQEQSGKLAKPGDVHEISEHEFAARLALFLWSSLPDQELNALAAGGSLRKPKILSAQIQRMLASPKAKALTNNFAGQWLYLRNLPLHFPDVFEFPNFDVPLRQSMRKETELFFERILQDNLSIFEFLVADYSYMNQRLAEHYGIQEVKGHAFRKVDLKNVENRGGLLGHGSILTVTSNPNHTSPVKRGKWILDNLLAATPPPPPPDVPALVAKHDGVALSAKEQLARHRADPVCASCHVRMDPLGLALEKFDAIGAHRDIYAEQVIDVTARMPDGTEFEGLPGLHSVLWDRRERFAQAFINRLLTYALARGLEPFDQPTVRSIAREASQNNYQTHSIIEAIVTSVPFNFRKVPESGSEQKKISKAH